MAKKVKHPEHVNHERWLVSYADFITLLFAFFTVLYATSQTDTKKTQQFVGSVERAFEMGIFDSGSTSMVFNRTSMSSGNGVYDLGISINDLKSNIEETIKSDPLNSQVSTEMRKEGLAVILQTVDFFESGSDVLKPKAYDTLARITKQLNATKYQVRVEGHTDSEPIHNARFPSNWDLSVARAMSVLKVLILDGVPADRLHLAGFASNQPIRTNKTAEGRSKNRRVELLILTEEGKKARSTSQAPAAPIPTGPLAKDLQLMFPAPKEAL